MGGAFHVNVYLSNTSSKPCVLENTSASVEYHDSAAGTISAPLKLGTRRVILNAGEKRSAALDLPNTCGDNSSNATYDRGDDALSVRYLGARTALTTKVPDGLTPCGKPLFVINSEDPPAAAGQIFASISDVVYRSESGVLTYTVTLKNSSDSVFTFGRTCPNSTEEANFGSLTSERYQLACATQRALQPGDLAAFAMKMTVTKHYSGTYRLSWGLDTGTIAIHQGAV